MASKHDAKRARENMWVTHQNLARSKGGRAGFEHRQRKGLPKAPPVPAPAPPADAELSAAPEAGSETADRGPVPPGATPKA